MTNGNSQTQHLKKKSNNIIKREQNNLQIIIIKLRYSYCRGQKHGFTDFFHLEFNGGFDLFGLLYHAVSVCEEGGELPCLAESRTQNTRDLLDETVRSKEGIVFLGCVWWSAKRGGKL